MLSAKGKSRLEIHYDTTLAELIKEDGKVTGIYAQADEGYVRYNASKGVIVFLFRIENSTHIRYNTN